jgi:hypothetical protein
MPRKSRFHLSGISVYIVQRRNNREAIFFDKADYQGYLWLAKRSCPALFPWHSSCLRINDRLCTHFSHSQEQTDHQPHDGNM